MFCWSSYPSLNTFRDSVIWFVHFWMDGLMAVGQRACCIFSELQISSELQHCSNIMIFLLHLVIIFCYVAFSLRHCSVMPATIWYNGLWRSTAVPSWPNADSAQHLDAAVNGTAKYGAYQSNMVHWCIGKTMQRSALHSAVRSVHYWVCCPALAAAAA